MHELNNEASIAKIGNNTAYIFKSIHSLTYLSVAGGVLGAYAETGYVASTGDVEQAAVPLMYVDGKLVSQYSGLPLGVNASSAGMVVEDDGTLPADSQNLTISPYLGECLYYMLMSLRVVPACWSTAVL
jgi:hypothetical protein